jgi:hypothetical protein
VIESFVDRRNCPANTRASFGRALDSRLSLADLNETGGPRFEHELGALGHDRHWQPARRANKERTIQRCHNSLYRFLPFVAELDNHAPRAKRANNVGVLLARRV